MDIGEEVFIPERLQKYNAVNSRICELRHEGYDFLMTCRGIAGGTRVTKLRNGTGEKCLTGPGKLKMV